ncbi:M15 family metallopeptidase [Corynebacterium sp. HMSC05E07]|nr:M15 family metallopeptidase [Corynebacterium sp. HMSC05E07]OFT63645.1 hypothetical protein HMPREF3149_00145 [Corynebacterium sp. HMSC05E07]
MIPRPWLRDYLFDEVRPHVPTDLPPLPPPVSHEQVRTIPKGENGDPLIILPPDIERDHKYLLLETNVMPDEMYLRQSVADRLRAAQKGLPSGFQIQILDSWRTMEAQHELMRLYLEEDPELREGSVSDANDKVVAPPHTTGGAVDLTLSLNGQGLPMGADFDAFGNVADFRFFEALDDTSDKEDLLARDLRRLLAAVLIEQGFAPYIQEWWHFSFGDQRWAAQYQRPESLFSTIMP